MKKLELVGEIDSQGKMVFEHLPVPSGKSGQVKVTIEYVDNSDEVVDPDDTSTEEVLASLKRSVKQMREGQRVPLSEIWEVLAEDDMEIEDE